MKKEKVMYIKLPDGAEYRRVEVTENGRIGIVYTEREIPKPLIGGTEVYQKDNGTPYWYCRIKEGRDEFMHLYFEDLTEDDLLFDANGNERKFKTDSQKEFKANILKALKIKPEEGYRWIPVFEPSRNSKGNLQYVPGKKSLRALQCHQWEYMFMKYSPKNGSKMASITTYFLLLLRWLKDGVATVEQLADDSRGIANCWNGKDEKHDFEKTGGREWGGLDFVGNTHKIVKGTGRFLVVGGCCSGLLNCENPLAEVSDCSFIDKITDFYSVGLLELTK